MTVYVFLGPSLPVPEAERILDAIYLPPVAMGDVARLVARKPTAIGIIDGLFERVPAVWHKEILFALAQGIPVYGASSMGALRAAELDAFGMIGVGKIFSAYRDGHIEDDDEVAVAHASAEQGFRTLSEPMVNIRDTLQSARSEGVISTGCFERLLGYAKSRFYPDRAWSDVLDAGAKLGILPDEIARLKQAYPKPKNVKREDAIRLLERIREDASRAELSHVPTFDFEPTSYWTGLAALETGAHTPADGEGLPVSVDALGRHIRLNRADRDALLRRALSSYLLFNEAKRCGIALGEVDGSAERRLVLLRHAPRGIRPGRQTRLRLRWQVGHRGNHEAIARAIARRTVMKLS